MLRIFATTIAAAGLLSGGALAATITQTVTFTDTTNETLVFDPFDTTLGTFSSASIVVSGNADIAAGTIDGTTEAARSFDNISINVDGFNVSVDAGVSLSGVFSGDVVLSGPFSFCQTDTAGDTCTDDYAPASKDFSLSDTSGSAALFTSGTPEIDVDIRTELDQDLGTPVSQPTTDWRVSGKATLTYEYVEAAPIEVVPLPASLPLALSGVALLGGLGYRRRNRRLAT